MEKIIRTSQPSELKGYWEEWGKNFEEAKANGKDFSWWVKVKGGRLKDISKKIRKYLLQMTDNHCAFCDKYLQDEMETIEHFLPKSKHPKSAYQWENLYPCCAKCNSIKKDQEGDLLRPDDADYYFETHFLVCTDSSILENFIQPSHIQEKIKLTILAFGLNRGSLIVARRKELTDYENEQDAEIYRKKMSKPSKRRKTNEWSYRFFIRATYPSNDSYNPNIIDDYENLF